MLLLCIGVARGRATPLGTSGMWPVSSIGSSHPSAPRNFNLLGLLLGLRRVFRAIVPARDDFANGFFLRGFRI
jgi:hypothetical protein